MFSVRGMGRRRQGQHIHAGKHLLELLLVRHAEPLFLVHNGETQGVEFHVFLHNAVGADDNIRLAAFDLLEDLLLPLCRDERDSITTFTGKCSNRRSAVW